MDEELEPLDAFSTPPEGEHEPREIAGRLVAEDEEFADLRTGEAAILFLMREHPKVKQGRMELGSLALPVFTGALGAVASWLLAGYCGGAPPDFIMVLDAQWWRQADPRQREALVFHELMHAAVAVDKEGEKRFDPDGKPVWAIRPHDLEEFNEVARRYGPWSPDIVAFMRAVEEGSR